MNKILLTVAYPCSVTIWPCQMALQQVVQALLGCSYLDLFQEVFDAVCYQENLTISYPDPQSYGKLAMGFLLSEIYEQMEDIINGASQPKLSLFSV